MTVSTAGANRCHDLGHALAHFNRTFDGAPFNAGRTEQIAVGQAESALDYRDL
jgi:hypothetical protein